MTREDIIDRLCAHQPDLLAHGVRHLALIGSVARGEGTSASDIDLAARFDGSPQTQGFAYFGTRIRLQKRLSLLLGRPVDIVDRDALKPALRECIDKYAIDAF